MQNRGRHKLWSKDDLVRVLSFYCQLQFGRMHSRNPIVVKFAKSLNRTPSSIALKLVNFASFDPALRKRGIRGMSNVSRLDRQVWDRFFGNWSVLARSSEAEQAASITWVGRRTATDRITTVRLGQGFFRNAVLSAYHGKCCITGISESSLLRAGHIVPWSASEENRLDPSNGICLNALHDAAFDSGLIGINEGLKVLISHKAKEAMPPDIFVDYFGRYDGREIIPPERFKPNRKSLQYHLQYVFIS